MSKLYISYAHKDMEFAMELVHSLRAWGHEVVTDIGVLTPGSEWRKTLLNALREAEVFLALLTANALDSPFVLTEVGAARAFAQASGNFLFVPVITDGIEIPPVVSDVQAILAPTRDIDQILADLDRAVGGFAARKAAQSQEQEKQGRALEAQAAEFVDEALISLRANASRDRRLSAAWYVAGFASLVLGMIFGLFALKSVSLARGDYLMLGLTSLKTLVIVGLLLAAAKYAFVLGRSYMSESLKSADRVHAISFGKFYLRAYGQQADWSQVKEVFQHWNISTVSSFGATSVDQFDPKYVESLAGLVKAVGSKSEG